MTHNLKYGKIIYDPETGRFISQDSIDYARNNTVNGLNLYCYCLNNPIKYVDFSGCIPTTNYYDKKSSTLNLFGVHHQFGGRFIVTATETLEQSEEPGIFYSYQDTNIGFISMYTFGGGINLWGWFGIDFSYNSENNISLGINITPYLHINASIGLDGISLGLGIVVNNMSYDLTIGLGLGPLIFIGGIALIIGSGGQALSNVWDWFIALFS